MARGSSRGSTPTPPEDDFEEHILDTDIKDEMESSYLEYAYSVIYSRALPDARDGLKPVQRRILYTMNDMRLFPDRNHVKSARVVGEAMGRFHPHGDGAIYDALVRMAQDWSLRLPMVDGHGNFGSPDAGPAAMRYCLTGDTRVRLADGRSVRIDHLADIPDDSELDADFDVLDKDGKPVPVSKVFNSGRHPVKRLVTKSGHELRGSHNHPLLCLVPIEGVPIFQWRRLDEIRPGTVVCLARNAWTTAVPMAYEMQLGTEQAASVCRDEEKTVPELVWNSGPDVKRAFLMALFEGDGGVHVLHGKLGDAITIQYSTYSRELARGLQELLLEFGIHSNLSVYERGEFRLVISGLHNIHAFAERVGFLTDKRRKLEGLLKDAPRYRHGLSHDYAPFVADYVRSTFPPGRGTGAKWFEQHNFDRFERWQADRSLIATKFKDPETFAVVSSIMDSGYRFVEVASVEDQPAETVYSIRVDSEDHSFLAGGFVNHNTECRMLPAAVAMTASLEEDTVDFRPTYDGSENEPTVLPAAIPNLVVNGTTGIAVGMATNMAPHNLVEVVAALRELIKRPGMTTEDLMRFVPGPDLPTGGTIVGLDGIRDAYETGRGIFKIRATARVEPIGRRKGIVVTELPYGVGIEKVSERIKSLVQTKKLQGIADLKDLTDMANGTRLVIEVKNGFVPEVLLEQLYKLTPLEDSFGINNVTLVDGQPRTLGLKQLLEVFLDHRYEVVRRRSQFRRDKAAADLHLVEGLLIAILDIDEVIQLIRSSENGAEAKQRLITVFDLSELQADYILDMALRRLTKFSRLELEKRKEELETTIEGLDAILTDDNLLKKVVSDELGEVATTYGTPRRTVLLASAGSAAIEAAKMSAEVADDPCFALLSSTGLLARTGNDEPIPVGGPRANHDVIVSCVATSARGEIGVVTSRGRLVKLGVLDLPAIPPTAGDPNLQGGVPLSALLSLEGGERALALVPLATDGPGIALGTRLGTVKRVKPEVLTRDDWEVIALADKDEVVGAVQLATGEEELCFITSDAQLLHFPASGVNPQGRGAGGVAGVRVAAGSRVVFFGAFDPAAEAVVVTASGSAAALPGTEPGSVKVTAFAEYPGKGRATGGVRCHRFLKGEDTLIFGWAGPAPARAAANSGAPVDLPAPDGKRDGSGVPGSQPIDACAGPIGLQRSGG
ncbi:MAG: DNA gyrase subunit A [Nocardioides sp.]